MSQTGPFIRTLGRLRDTFWRRRVIIWWLRALWMALLVPTVVMMGYLWWDWNISWHIWLSVMLLVGVISFVWSMRPISIQKMTHRLDNLLAMRAKLITAYEVSRGIAPESLNDNPVAEQLVHDSVVAAADLRRRVKLLGHKFWFEVQALVAVAALLAALLLFDSLQPNIPQVPPIDLPLSGQEPSAEQVVPPELPQPQNPQQQPIDDSQIRNILQILADALRDQAITRAVAEAIDRDDISGAASELRRLADRLDDLSRAAHQELGHSLQEAADNIGDTAPAITDPLRRGQQALDINNMPGAGQSLEDLAEAIENLTENPPESGQSESQSEEQPPQPEDPQEASQQEGGGGEESQAGAGSPPPDEEEERLPIDGKPLELGNEDESEERVQQLAELGADANEDSKAKPGFARQPLNAAGDELGPDPLTYPWEKRDIIRQYFTP